MTYHHHFLSANLCTAVGDCLTAPTSPCRHPHLILTLNTCVSPAGASADLSTPDPSLLSWGPKGKRSSLKRPCAPDIPRHILEELEADQAAAAEAAEAAAMAVAAAASGAGGDGSDAGGQSMQMEIQNAMALADSQAMHAGLEAGQLAAQLPEVMPLQSMPLNMPAGSFNPSDPSSMQALLSMMQASGLPNYTVEYQQEAQQQ